SRFLSLRGAIGALSGHIEESSVSVQATCEGCGEPFEAVRSSAKWCSDRCRKAAARAADSQADSASPEPDDYPSAAGLVASVREELEAAGRLRTFHGQLALQLACKLASPDESGISSLSKELRTVMATALDGVTSPSSEGEPDAADDDEDEVTRARRQREQARQAAGLA
ncbi:MAG TPA: hypothetical protein VGF17_20780, partial [Phytomonospora sp.]